MRILRFCIIFFIGHLGKFRSFENVGIPRAFGDFRNFGIFLRQCLLERIFWNFWDYGAFGHLVLLEAFEFLDDWKIWDFFRKF